MRVALPDAFLTRPIAHRGYHDRSLGRIENSPAAFAAAVHRGYGIELDLQLSADSVAIVFHDETLDRLTDKTGPLNAWTAAELGALRLTGSADTIPTLAQVLAQVGGRVPLLIEIKDQSLTMAPTDGALEAAAVADLVGYAGPVALMSFNPDSVAHVARLAPHLPRGLTSDQFDPGDWAPLAPQVCARLRGLPDYEPTGCSFISHGASDLGSARVAELLAAGAVVLCWTIRSPQAEALARKIAANVTFEGYAA
jgi:glycerophosphoryl diester phosphodiesterase